MDLQNIDDRRKRDLTEKHKFNIKELEKREAMHIGFMYVHDK
jgi:hypothetical protein